MTVSEASTISNALPNSLSPVDLSVDDVALEILAQIDEQDVINLDTLIVLLPQYSWSQIFHAVDCLARCGKIVLRRSGQDDAALSRCIAATISRAADTACAAASAASIE